MSDQTLAYQEQSQSVSPPMDGKKSLLESLYDFTEVEMVHAISESDYVNIVASFVVGERSLKLPPGNYLIVRVVDPVMIRPGLFAKRAPKPVAPDPE